MQVLLLESFTTPIKLNKAVFRKVVQEKSTNSKQNVQFNRYRTASYELSRNVGNGRKYLRSVRFMWRT